MAINRVQLTVLIYTLRLGHFFPCSVRPTAHCKSHSLSSSENPQDLKTKNKQQQKSQPILLLSHHFSQVLTPKSSSSRRGRAASAGHGLPGPFRIPVGVTGVLSSAVHQLPTPPHTVSGVLMPFPNPSKPG